MVGIEHTYIQHKQQQKYILLCEIDYIDRSKWRGKVTQLV